MNFNEQRNFPLAKYTSWWIGGNAARFYQPKSTELLSAYLKQLPAHIPWVWLGLGSNVLIADQGIDGAVICSKSLTHLSHDHDNLMAMAGITCAKFAKFATQLGFAKAAFFAGIPGTIGGALAMNAGAFGGETWEWVRTVKLRVTPPYPEAFLGATFRFPHEPLVDGMDNIKALLKRRNETQPIGTRNCGSVFRNPPGDYAARLIEACDLKGFQMGGAMISPKHANFIINTGQAKADEVSQLISLIQQTVNEKFGIELQPEVKLLPAWEQS